MLDAGPDAVRRGADVLRRGGLLALPTETVYGLGADASSAAAVSRVYSVKGRPADHPLIVHFAASLPAFEWASSVSTHALALADAFWPGPLTLVVRRAAHVLDAVTGGQDTVGLRVPSHPVALALLRSFGGGVAAPSANRFGRVSPTTAAHVCDDLGAYLDPALDAILDGGPCVVGVESTIVDCSGAFPHVLRHGGITADRLAAVLGRSVGGGDTTYRDDTKHGDGRVRAPGGLAAHYAPRALVELVDGDDLIAIVGRHAGRIGALVPRGVALPVGVVRLDAPDSYDGEALAPILYARLREADRAGLDVLLVMRPQAKGLGIAVLDRLVRAATGSSIRGVEAVSG